MSVRTPRCFSPRHSRDKSCEPRRILSAPGIRVGSPFGQSFGPDFFWVSEASHFCDSGLMVDGMGSRA